MEGVTGSIPVPRTTASWPFTLLRDTAPRASLLSFAAHACHHTAGRQPKAVRRSPSPSMKSPPSIGAGLRKAALAGRVDGKLVDTSYRHRRTTRSSPSSPKRIRPASTSSATPPRICSRMAVKQLFPEAQVTIGPVIEDGFYYDFAFERPFTPEDLAAIEARMTRDRQRPTCKVRAASCARDEAVALFQHASARTTRPRSSPASRRTSPSASTARATGSTCAAARTCRRPAS